MVSSSVWSLFLFALLAQASTLSLKSPRFTVLDPTGSQIRQESLSAKTLSKPVKLDAKDTLRLAFQVVDDESGKGVQPHQTFLRFYDEKNNEEGIQPVRVTPGGKAKFDLNPSKPPLSLPPTPNQDPLKVSLIIGSPKYDPITIELFDLILPASQPAPQHPDAAAFQTRPEIQHTFRPDHKQPPKPISAVFSLLVAAPWVVLLGLWSQVAPSPTRAFSPSILPFILSLGALEGLLFWYWVDLKLGQVLLYGFFLAIPTVLTGKQALTSIGGQRVGRK
ncbi:oligosaccharyl transferase delta subunit [Panaeolus papilionaceus]|nr:oligosaccharyl transferase delta subunit [Panaeolus papilionaceus]